MIQEVIVMGSNPEFQRSILLWLKPEAAAATVDATAAAGLAEAAGCEDTISRWWHCYTQKAGYREVPGHVGAVVKDGQGSRVEQPQVVGPRVGSVQAASGAAEDGS